jgi:hypothetical protein
MFFSNGGPRFVMKDRRPMYFEGLTRRLSSDIKFMCQKRHNHEKDCSSLQLQS